MTRFDPTADMLRFFEYDHLSAPLREVSGQFCVLAEWIAGHLEPGPEKTAGMRKLLEAKDCAVRAALNDTGESRS